MWVDRDEWMELYDELEAKTAVHESLIRKWIRHELAAHKQEVRLEARAYLHELLNMKQTEEKPDAM